MWLTLKTPKSIHDEADTTPIAICKTPDRPTAKRFEHDFENAQQVGQGTFGQVMKAVHRLDKQVYGIKRLKIANSENADERGKMLREVATLSRLSHNNVVRYYQAWIEDCYVDDGDLGSDYEDETDQDELEEFLSTCEECEASYEPWKLCIASQSIFLPEDGKLCQPCFQARLQKSGLQSLCQAISFETLASSSLNKVLFIQMEYCPFTLRDFISIGEHFLSQELTVHYFTQLAHGLSYVHSCNIIHRDIKPENIFISPSTPLESLTADDLCRMTDEELGMFQIKLGDFGLARFNNQPRRPQRRKSSMWHAACVDELDPGNASTDIGSLLYLPPNQGYIWDEKVDIYALGIVLFEMLYPFNTGMERLIQLRELRQPKLHFPKGFESLHFPEAVLIRKLLTLEASQRPPAAEVVLELSTWCDGSLRRVGSSPLDLFKASMLSSPTTEESDARMSSSLMMSYPLNSPPSTPNRNANRSDRVLPMTPPLSSGPNDNDSSLSDCFESFQITPKPTPKRPKSTQRSSSAE